MSTTIHAMRIEIHTEEGAVTLDLKDEPGILTARLRQTPDQAEMLAAELLMAADKARHAFLEGIA